jgi:hypothetical protein
MTQNTAPPKRVALILDEEQLQGMNAMFYHALALRDDDVESMRVGRIEVRKISDHAIHQIANKLFHCNQVLGKK